MAVHWERYCRCWTCGAAPGEPCLDLRYRQRRVFDEWPFAQWPHPGRPRRKQ